MPLMDSQRHLPGHQLRAPVLHQTMRRSSDQPGMLLSGVQLPQYPPSQDIYPGCHPGLNPALIMRPGLPHADKSQVSYPTGFHSLSPGDAEALYNCMDPKLWAESMLNPMMLPPMFDTYYNGLDFHAPGYRKNVTKETTGPLKAWLQDHRKNPYPTKAEKIMLAIITKMTLTQVSTWFANARRRLKKETGRSSPGMEEDGRSDDETEGSDASRSKHGSDHEDEGEEISVDDDEDREDLEHMSVAREDSEGVLRFQPVRRIPDPDMKTPGRNNGHYCSSSRVTSREQTFPRHGTDYMSGSLGRDQCSSKSSKSTTSFTASPLVSAEQNEQKMLYTATESQARPVDLSQSASPRGGVCQKQHQLQQQQQYCHSEGSTNRGLANPINNSPIPKAKIWSISNILSLESKNGDT